jgi:hypothetical protein
MELGPTTSRPAGGTHAKASTIDAPERSPRLTSLPPGPVATTQVPLLGSRGYVESEYLLTGTAASYRQEGTWGPDGRWNMSVSQPDQSFVTRLLVVRPSDPDRFSGTVWVEWLNVTGGCDAPVSMVQAHDQVVVSGAAWVGVSAQRVGVDALKQLAGNRYSALDLSSDELSYDIYAQAGQAVRDDPALLGGVSARWLLGVGDSQSALRLTTYLNAWHDQSQPFDGFIVHSRFTTGAPIGDGLMDTTATRIRDDVTRPVLQLQTEVDVGLDLDSLVPGLGTWEGVRQSDRGNVHTWEVAGAAHADQYLLTRAGTDLSPHPLALLAPTSSTDPVNDFPFHYAANAAFAALERWVTTGQRPASTPPIETVEGIIQRDADGNALGGLRLPDIDVAISQYNATPSPDIAGALFGSSRRFTPRDLQVRYGSSREYVAAYRASADAAVAAHVMTPMDRDAGVAAATAVAFTSPPVGPTS